MIVEASNPTRDEVRARAEARYPALMQYIANRSALAEGEAWAQLRADEKEAVEGKFDEVAAELERVRADYKDQQEGLGKNGYPYNSDMGIFLGLEIRSNGEPVRGYYFANKLRTLARFAHAKREVEVLLAGGAHLRVIAARDSKTRKPIRFTTFLAHQIAVEGNTVVCRNDRKSVRLSSNWSVETALERVACALRTGQHYE